MDGALFFDQQRDRISIVVRDSKAAICFVASIGISYIKDLEIVKLLALLRGPQLYLAWGISHLLVESDNQLMVNACNSSTFQGSHLGKIVEEIRRT